MGLFSKRKEAVRRQKEIGKNREEWEKSAEFISKILATHSEGLPHGEDISYIYLCKDKIAIKFLDGNEYDIRLDKVDNIFLTTEKEMITELKRSLGKAVVGGALFGVAGAIVGGAPKSKEKVKKVHQYLGIQYVSKDNEDALLTFEVFDSLTRKSSPHYFIEEFKNIKGIANGRKIEL